MFGGGRKLKHRPLGIGFTGAPYGIRNIVKFARGAERRGFSSFWFAEDYYLRDAISNVSCVAYSTENIRVSTGIINPFTRHPVLIAETMATLDELSDGRANLALGTGVLPLIKRMGISVHHPALAMREAVFVIRSLLEGKKLNFTGEVFSTEDVVLGDNPYLQSSDGFPRLSNIPIYLAAIGPKMLALAGEVADGVLLTVGLGPENVERSLREIEKGAAKADRSAKELDTAGYVLTCLGSPGRSIKRFSAFRLAHASSEDLTVVGVPERIVNEVREAYMKNGIDSASLLVTDKTASYFAAFGTKEQIEGRIEEFRKSGLTHPILMPRDTNPLELMNSLA